MSGQDGRSNLDITRMSLAACIQERSPERSILGVNVSASSYAEMIQRSLHWAEKHQSRALFFVNVHVIMEALDDPRFCEYLNKADMVNPDGMPLVWALRALGERRASRVYGPDATAAMLIAAEEAGIPVGFYGGNQSALNKLVDCVRRRHPKLQIVFMESPPFRALTVEEDNATVGRIAASGVRLLFIGLGCPKQERWIMEHIGKVPAVMFGVGAAFDFLSGAKPQAPRWMMRCGLEWAFRFAHEPRRLAKRYLKHNPRFIARFLYQLFGERVRLRQAQQIAERPVDLLTGEDQCGGGHQFTDRAPNCGQLNHRRIAESQGVKEPTDLAS
jgi:N-acetylglucosaminyldiphosphoundecaprenol N-acetyl-beta-D-mannosaminyltransferase